MAGLYIHVPFCRRKCFYCDFVSGPWDEEVMKRYFSALLKEMECSGQTKGMPSLCFDTIYIGGGTPSVAPAIYLERLIQKAFDVFTWDTGEVEITVEANPESMSHEWLEAIARCGVNRLSIGFQAMSEDGLLRLGRPHTVSQAVEAYEAARRQGFPLVSVDLIYGWPGQTVSEWESTLEMVISLGPDHISCYELSVEENTPFYEMVKNEELFLPDEDLILELTDLTEGYLASEGYRQYEISNFALPGKECRHNLNYWANGPYLGLGASAVSFVPPVRYKNMDHVPDYIRHVQKHGSAVDETEELDPEGRFRESVILGLRLKKGLVLCELKKKWGIDPLDYYGETLSRLVDSGLLKVDGGRLFLSDRGRRIANYVLSELV